MYYKLLNEIAKKGITRKSLANRIGVTEKTLFNKLNGRSDFTFTELKKIRNIVAPEYNLEKLFEIK